MSIYFLPARVLSVPNNYPRGGRANVATFRPPLWFTLFTARTLISTWNMLIGDPLLTWEKPSECICHLSKQLSTQLHRLNSSHLLLWHTSMRHLEAPSSHMACHGRSACHPLCFQKCDCVTQSIRRRQKQLRLLTPIRWTAGSSGGGPSWRMIRSSAWMHVRKVWCFFPVTEDGRKVPVEFVHNLWWHWRLVESTRYSIVSTIAKVEYTFSRASESVRDPMVGNRKEPLRFQDQVRDTADILANLAQTPLQLLCPLLAIHGQEIAIVNEFFSGNENAQNICRRTSSAYFCVEEGTSCASNPCAVLSVIIQQNLPKRQQTAAPHPHNPQEECPAPGNSTRISASGTYACIANMKSLRRSASRIEVCRLWIRLSIFAPHRCKRTHFSYRESHYRRRDGPLSLPDPSVAEQKLSISGFTICTPLSEMQIFVTTSYWQCRHTYLRLIFEWSFPVADTLLGDYEDAVPPFAAVWEDFVEMITDRTAQGLDAQDVPSSTQKYAELVLLADVLGRSRFLKKTRWRSQSLGHGSQGEGREVEAAFGQVCQYVSSVSHLILKAKAALSDSPPLGHGHFRWHGRSVFDLCDSAYDAVSRGLNQSPMSPEIVDKLDRHFPSILSNWKKHQTLRTCIHAERRNHSPTWPTATGPCCPPDRGQ